MADSNIYQKLKKLIPYTDQDYDSIYNSMKNSMPELLPEYNDTSDTDPGMRIFQEIARVADVLSWKIDVSANQALPGNATLRRPVLAHAAWMNYVPVQRRAAKCSDLEISIMNDGREFTIPKGTKFATGYDNDDVVFCTTEAIQCSPPENVEYGEAYTVTAECENAESVIDYVGTSDGSASQIFYLENTDYIEGSLEVDVLDEDEETLTTFEVVNSIFDVGYNENKVILSFDENNYGKLQFGDGITGAIPNENAQIICRYKIGGGESGNVLAGFITKCLENIPGGIILGCSNLSDAIGGENVESVESINKNAPYHFVTGDRLVSWSDCRKWFEAQWFIGEGNVAYEADSDYIDVYNFYLAPKNREYDAVPDDIKKEYLQIINGDDSEGIDGICMMGEEIVIKDPIWKDIEVDVSITCSKLFQNSDITTGVRQEIFDALNDKKFDEDLVVSDVYDAVRTVDGVLKVRINKLCLKGKNEVVEIDCDFNEIIRVANIEDIKVSMLL